MGKSVFIIAMYSLGIFWASLFVFYYYNVYRIIKSLKKENKEMFDKLYPADFRVFLSIPILKYFWYYSVILLKIPHFLLRNPEFFKDFKNIKINVKRARIALISFIAIFGGFLVTILLLALIL